jgi:phosphoserine aminotransferase
MQFSQIVYNLIPDLRNSKRPVDYLVTGTWSQKAAEEAKRLYENVNIVFSTQQTKQYVKIL